MTQDLLASSVQTWRAYGPSVSPSAPTPSAPLGPTSAPTGSPLTDAKRSHSPADRPRSTDVSGDEVDLPELLAEQAEHRLTGLGWSTRWRRLWQRHRVREQRAESYFASSRAPKRGLPVARASVAFAFVRDLVDERRGLFTVLIVVNVLAAVAGLAVPRLLGSLVDRATAGGTVATLDSLALVIAIIVLGQALLTFVARWVSTVFGQDLLADARERVVRLVLRLPLSRIESSSSGDLVTRITRDVTIMSEAARDAAPAFVLNGVLIVLSVVAMVLNSALLAVPTLVAGFFLFFIARAYLRRAPKGYITEGGTYSRINATITETVEGARTIEALGLKRVRLAQTERDLQVSAQAERYTMTLRNLLFTTLDYAFQGPLVGIVLLGTWGYSQGWVTLGQITAATLYSQQLFDPVDRIIHIVDRLQVALASTTRLLGLAEVPADRVASGARPTGTELRLDQVRFAYRESHDVLHDVDLDVVPGERLAIVGPSGSGKSTLGRLAAGINPPRVGTVTIGGVEATELPLDQLRTQVALVTQEHHVFVGSIRDNVVLAREDSTDQVVNEALAAVDAREWVERLPDGIQTVVGSGGHSLTPAQAQQIALARLVIADPHTLVLDEATSLIDPRTARHLEGSMHALLAGRTVVAIAHRLHTAHDADRIAVVIDGRIAELGSHHQLMDLDGEYAALWRAWTR